MILVHSEPDFSLSLSLGIRLDGPFTEPRHRHDAAAFDVGQGDRWRFTIPAYLGYGYQGRRYTPPEETLKRDIPPGSTLSFDVELVAIVLPANRSPHDWPGRNES